MLMSSLRKKLLTGANHTMIDIHMTESKLENVLKMILVTNQSKSKNLRDGKTFLSSVQILHQVKTSSSRAILTQ